MSESPVKPPSGVQHAAEEEAIERRTLRDYIITLRERLWIALPLALIVSLTMAYQQMKQTPMYSSSATLQFERPEKVVLNEQVVDESVRSDVDLNTNIQVLNSGQLRSRVIESITPEEAKVLQAPYLASLKPGESPPSVGAALGSISVEPLRNSLLLRISVSHRSPTAAALIANRYVDEFMQYLVDSKGGKNDFAVSYLRTRAEQLRHESETAEQRLQQYMQQQNLVSLDNSINIVTDRLKSVNGALTSARLERLQLETLYNQITSFQKDGKNLLDITYIATHGPIPSLKGQLTDLQRSQSVLADRYLERHPKMIELANAISVAQNQLSAAVNDAIADLSASLSKARTTEANMQKEYAAHEQEAFRLRELSVDFKSLENQANVAKNNYVEILNRLNQATTSKNLDNIPVRPLDRAVPAGAPFSPNIQRILKSCIGTGIIVFLAVAIGISFIDDRIKSAWDVESFIGANLLGIIPDLSSVKDDEKYRLVLNSNAHGAEAFLGIYSAAKIYSKLDFPKSILVTSTIPGEGKTLVSCNLAGCFARHGKKTLLIDCDLRRPMLHRHFNQQNDAGLMLWYENGAKLDGDLMTDAHLGLTQVGDNLWLLCSGGRSKTPTELLENAAFGQLLERFKRLFDVVLVDSPPLGAVTDSLLIAERTDEVIYVCRFNRAYRKHIRLYMRALRGGKNEVLGVVLNGLSPRRIEYYSNYRYYRSYKKYYGSQT
ncbi:polysaccharide biosynthesis tyrosine autokinase [Horticoccus luteus]|uniref:Polysaccharide biosynthesis tyrosine autokinase n=1 Tax=Horticoccus luteus TaxID=2862869 RepID=A0A8F9XK32_9BACT|nr:polysaccharide biosynthesis tyrosine autokinase [Horticoccus luteus]QYM77679.1 polysaccharide biosynthesis tyrosine autokinase [Horticoccus luteus]